MELMMHSLAGLRARRQLLNITGAEMAHRLGITQTTYLRYERGERRAYWDQVRTIANILEVDPRVLDKQPDFEEQAILFRRGQVRQEAKTNNMDPDQAEELRRFADTHWNNEDEAEPDDTDEPIGSVVTPPKPVGRPRKPISPTLAAAQYIPDDQKAEILAQYHNRESLADREARLRAMVENADAAREAQQTQNPQQDQDELARLLAEWDSNDE